MGGSKWSQRGAKKRKDIIMTMHRLRHSIPHDIYHSLRREIIVCSPFWQRLGRPLSGRVPYWHRHWPIMFVYTLYRTDGLATSLMSPFVPADPSKTVGLESADEDSGSQKSTWLYGVTSLMKGDQVIWVTLRSLVWVTSGSRSLPVQLTLFHPSCLTWVSQFSFALEHLFELSRVDLDFPRCPLPTRVTDPIFGLRRCEQLRTRRCSHFKINVLKRQHWAIKARLTWFYGVVGYHASLTRHQDMIRTRSAVQSRVES